MNFDFDPINVPGITVAKLWIKSGSSSDQINQKGSHQLLCSLLTRGCGQYNHIEIANFVEGSGASLRSETYEDGILISLKCADNDSDKLLPLIGLMINEPHLELNQINLEKDLTIQSLKRQKENPFHIAFDLWRKIAYKNGPYSHDPLGTEKDLERITQKSLRKLAESLKEKQKFLVIAGSNYSNREEKIKSIDTLKELKSKSCKEYAQKNLRLKNIDSRMNLIFERLDTEQVVLILGRETIPYINKDALPLSLLCSYLGSGMSSLLFRKLREEYGVAYEVGVHYPVRENNAPFLIHASTTKEKALTTLKLIMEIWIELSNTCITNSNIILTRAKFRGQIAHNLQTSGQRAERIVQLNSLNLPKNYDHINIQRIENINSETLLDVAKRHLNEPILSICGPEESIEKISRYWQSQYNFFKNR